MVKRALDWRAWVAWWEPSYETARGLIDEQESYLKAGGWWPPVTAAQIAQTPPEIVIRTRRSGLFQRDQDFDRLARSMKQLIETIESLRLRGIGFGSLTEASTRRCRKASRCFTCSAPWCSSSGRSCESAPAQDSRPQKRMRRTRGRPAKPTEDDLNVARTLLANPDITVADVADRIGVSPATLYQYIPAARAANAPDVWKAITARWFSTAR